VNSYIYQFHCCFVSGRCISLLVILYYWLFSRTICSVVNCEGGITTLSCNPLPSQNPRSPGTSPLGLTSLKRKNHPIVVTLGGIGSCYASLTLQPLAFYPCHKLCDNSTHKPSLISAPNGYWRSPFWVLTSVKWF
jgi:hypothetical protein